MTTFSGIRPQKVFSFLLYTFSIFFLGYWTDRSDFISLICPFAIAFGVYYYWFVTKTFGSESSLLTVAVLVRLLLILAIPLLSDDYHRFIWDGSIGNSGLDPYGSLPSELIARFPELQTTYDSLNSQEYYSVYPPMMQWVFRLAASTAGIHPLAPVVVMRCILILADVGIILVGFRILRSLGKSTHLMALYAFNPLVVIELTANLHFEGLMLFFSILSIWILMRQEKTNSVVGSSLAMALGVVTKLTNLLFAFPLIRRLSMGKFVLWSLVLACAVVVAFLPFYEPDLISHFTSSLDLYFRNFQFNSSLFRLGMELSTSWIPHFTAHYVGPFLSGFSVLLMLLVLFRRKKQDWQNYFVTLLFILFIHLMFTSTVHPWYVVNLILISCFTRYRFALVWSFMVLLSYFMYGNDLLEPWWLICIEYAVVLGVFFYELRLNKTQVSKG